MKEKLEKLLNALSCFISETETNLNKAPDLGIGINKELISFMLENLIKLKSRLGMYLHILSKHKDEESGILELFKTIDLLNAGYTTIHVVHFCNINKIIYLDMILEEFISNDSIVKDTQELTELFYNTVMNENLHILN